MTEADFAWLAGIIDGEGVVGSYINRTRSRTCLFNKVAIISTDEVIVREVEAIYRSLGIQNQPKFHKCGHCKKGGYWNLQVAGKKQLRQLLPRVIPYLRLKDKQAKLLLQIVSTEVKPGRQPGGAYHRTPDSLIEISEKIRDLNQRTTLSQTGTDGPVGGETGTPAR